MLNSCIIITHTCTERGLWWWGHPILWHHLTVHPDSSLTSLGHCRQSPSISVPTSGTRHRLGIPSMSGRGDRANRFRMSEPTLLAIRTYTCTGDVELAHRFLAMVVLRGWMVGHYRGIREEWYRVGSTYGNLPGHFVVVQGNLRSCQR